MTDRKWDHGNPTSEKSIRGARQMKIHRWSPWLRKHWTWAPLTVRTIDAILFPAAVIGLVWFGIDDLKAWLI